MKKLALGLMSGTSADGLSIAAITVKPFKVVAYGTFDYTPEMQKEILSARDMKAPALSLLNFRLGVFYAACVEKFCRKNKIPCSAISVIGSHGQTVCHYPEDKPGHTLQIGEASFIAEKTGVPVVCDFRPRDMAAGGEGAPLIPFMDDYLFGGGSPVLLQNIGGIGNVAVVGRDVKTLGFDTGPGNCLMDTAVQNYSGGKMKFDTDGKLAARGKADMKLVEKFLSAPFFARRPPKSLDRDTFSAAFLKKHWRGIGAENIADVVATLNRFTAESIALSVKRFVPAKYACREMIVSGGGALNPVLMKNLSGLLPFAVSPSSAHGMHELAKEPACFALLAALALEGKNNHCPAATGARHNAVLGKIIPA